jgi:hypothetical protein
MLIAYRIYPGTKVNNSQFDGNYHIVSDHKYNITVNINSDCITYDGSVNAPTSGKSAEAVKVSLPAGHNCYMIHPKISNKSGYILYQMPIFERINEFWGHKTWYTGEANEITDDTEWVAEVIWQDIPTQVMGFSDASGTNTLTTTYSGKGKTPVYFKLKSLDHYGNIVVGVKKKGETAYLWSWHLWVTDYCPDAAPSPRDAEKYHDVYLINKAYVHNNSSNPYGDATLPYVIDYQSYMYHSGGSDGYPVYGNKIYGGNVQHFNHLYDKYWASGTPSRNVWDTQSGIYYDKWIMDRNLGSFAPTNCDIAEPIKGFGSYYQYGRKDPFAYQDTYTISGSKRTNKWTTGSGGTLSNGVRNPNVFYTNNGNGPWLSDYNDNYWYDIYEGDKEIKRGEKSIFDPCPPGWCIPISDAFYFTTYDQPLAVYGGGAGHYDAEPGASFAVYIDYRYNSSQGKYEPNDYMRNIAVITSLVKYNGGASRNHLDAVYPMQGNIRANGTGWDGFVNVTDRQYFSGCYWTVENMGNGIARYLRMDNNNLSCRAYYYRNNRYTYRFESHLQINDDAGAARGHSVRCIQEPD